MKPFSEACERNKDAILSVLRETFPSALNILEIGSGSGQHAVYFARQLPHLTWHTSDLHENHAGILAWLREANLPNVRAPLELDVTDSPWPLVAAGGVFSANTAHIMSWNHVEKMFVGVGHILAQGDAFCLYGPFNYDGQYTSQSNAKFDAWLQARDPQSGLRDFAEVDRLAREQGLLLLKDYVMPANNHCLVWLKKQ